MSLALLLLGEVWAKKTEVDWGAALDVQAAAFIPDSGPVQTAAGWQAEGDLAVYPDSFRLMAELDFGGGIGTLFPATLVYLSPERLSVRVGIKKFWFEGGVLPPPWGMESVDPWRNALVSWSALRRPGAGAIQGAYGPDGMVPLGSLIGGGLGIGDQSWGIMGLAGLDLPSGINLIGQPLEDLRGSQLLVGGHAWYQERRVTVSGGLYAHPIDQTPLTFDLGAQVRPKDFWITGEGSVSTAGDLGFMLLGELLPNGRVSPALRLELTRAEGPGAALGVTGNIADFFRLKAEVRYAQRTPSLWAEATLFLPETGARAAKPGW
ncbi:MAG TPA: hypothetical protein PKW90_02435 [Myxococcota bacterium]|nr:hypothetical protein [Myxococcota bacterium]